MNFQTLQERVEGWVLELPDSTESLIASWINEAIREAEDRHNFAYMRDRTDYVTADGVRSIGAVPERFKEPAEPPYTLRDDEGIRTFDWAPNADQMRLQYAEDDDGDPEFLLMSYDPDAEETQLHVWPLSDGKSDYTDGQYRIHVPYWRYSAELENNSDTNWLTDNAHQYIIYRATAIALEFNRDEARSTRFANRAEQQYQLVRRRDVRRGIPPSFTLNPGRNVNSPTVRPRRSGRAFGRYRGL